ncbi:response regulator, partial [Nostoc sp. CHAB 5834]|nr:response regulator [Nostoc sp. CHAB 5834]
DLNQTQQQYLSIVNQSGNALLGILNDILDFSKIEAGKLELVLDEVDLYELTSQAADIITYQAQSKGLEVLLNLSPRLPRFIEVDAIRLKQVLVNLLGNAVKFTEGGEIELAITAVSPPEESPVLLRFEVRDTGIGIKAAMLATIFDAFTQEDPSTTKRYGGTGLGLTISNKLLALMGSRLQVESQLGVGSRFFFDIRLPARVGEPLLWNEGSPIRHVLIVDDNAHNRVIIRQLLLIKQITSEEASNGLEALALLARGGRYDVILMDYHMPYLDGLETVENIRQTLGLPPALQPVILLHSSSDDERIGRACESLAIQGRLLKPVKLPDLYGALDQLTRQPSPPAPLPRLAPPLRVDERSLTVLIVDDNRVNQLLTRTLIGQIVPRARVVEAANGLEALTQVEDQRPDLILMDVQMPLLNGYQATQRIRALELESGPRTPIIALTAGTVKGERETCLAAGMDDFLAKPLQGASLRQVVEKWLAVSGRESSTPFDHPSTDNHFDAQFIYKITGHDPALIAELIALAAGELVCHRRDFKEQLEAGQLAGLQRVGHKLAGLASSAGMPTLARLARGIEQTVVFNTHDLTEQIRQIDKEIELVGLRLEAFNLNSPP